MPIAAELIKGQTSRNLDAYGSGQYLASRGEREHQGIDIISTPGETIFSPISGNVIREAFPYKMDKSFVGVVIRGTQDWMGYEVKLFYVTGLFTGAVKQGEVLGLAQNISAKYPGITNHVHVETRLNNKALDPRALWGRCL